MMPSMIDPRYSVGTSRWQQSIKSTFQAGFVATETGFVGAPHVLPKPHLRATTRHSRQRR